MRRVFYDALGASTLLISLIGYERGATQAFGIIIGLSTIAMGILDENGWFDGGNPE